MFDKYIILNRKPKIIIKLFIYILIFLFALLIYLSNTLIYTSYYSTNSYITFINNSYYLKLTIPIDKLKLITKENKIVLDNKIYTYQIHKIDPDIVDNNYQVIYLNISNLDKSYKINNYLVKIKLKEKETELINFLKGG